MMADLKKNALESIFEKKKILICCGSGGVGKTTTAAALAVYAASIGYKTIVLTIDPAKRLANSLGIKRIDFQEKQIPKSALENAGVKAQAPLYAMMLDTKRTFDEIITKYSPDAERAQAILENRLYQHLSSLIGGSQEYMAMEKVYEISQERDYDLIIVDTPPSRHALDFLEAPNRMSSMVGDSILKWFLKPGLFVSRSSIKFLDKSMKRIFKTFDKVAGFEFLQDLSTMLVSTSGLLEGFQERAQKVELLLHDEETGFLLISAPQPIPLREATYFYHKIEEYRFPFSGFIFNRVQPLPASATKLPAGLPSIAKGEYSEIQFLFKSLHQRDLNEIKNFKKQITVQDDLFFKMVPQFDHDIHDLKGLYELGINLFAKG
jgi:anion-transporting  ArsA/GET3 family ATPase